MSEVEVCSRFGLSQMEYNSLKSVIKAAIRQVGWGEDVEPKFYTIAYERRVPSIIYKQIQSKQQPYINASQEMEGKPRITHITRVVKEKLPLGHKVDKYSKVPKLPTTGCL